MKKVVFFRKIINCPDAQCTGSTAPPAPAPAQTHNMAPSQQDF